MIVDVLNMKGEKVETVDLPAEIFETELNTDLIHQAFVQQMANARLGTHKTKTRSEVSGGGRKPWKQKGTGRARQGSTRAPQWAHGGKIHTPQPRKYTQHMPVKMRRAALRSALSAKAADAGVIIVDDLLIPEPKTKQMAKAMKALVGDSTVLVLAEEKTDVYETIMRSSRNLRGVKLILASYLNIRDLLNYDKLVMPIQVLDMLKAQLV